MKFINTRKQKIFSILLVILVILTGSGILFYYTMIYTSPETDFRQQVTYPIPSSVKGIKSLYEKRWMSPTRWYFGFQIDSTDLKQLVITEKLINIEDYVKTCFFTEITKEDKITSYFTSDCFSIALNENIKNNSGPWDKIDIPCPNPEKSSGKWWNPRGISNPEVYMYSFEGGVDTFLFYNPKTQYAYVLIIIPG
jgi:hypothetical protein